MPTTCRSPRSSTRCPSRWNPRLSTPVDWNAELLGGDLADAVRRLKERPGRGISLGGVQLPAALAAAGLIDEYTFVVHPVVAGRGPRLLDGIRDQLRLELVARREFRSGASVQRYRPVL